MNFVSKLVKLLFILSVFSKIDGYRILGIFPMNSKSHNNMFEVLMEGLAKRGHQVDVVTHFEMKTPPKNYRTIINLAGTRPGIVNNLTIDYALNMGSDPIPHITKTFGNELCELLALEEMQNLIKTPPKDHPYDVVITEAFAANCFIGFGYILKVPVITVSSILEFPWATAAIGNSASTAFAANVFMDSASISTFWDRLKSTVIFHVAKFRFYMYTDKVQTEAMRKYLSPDIPNIREVERSVALMFTNNYHSLFGVRSVTPAVVDIAGIHAEENNAKFTPDLQKWMDESKHGVVYFSLGSMVIIESLPKETLIAFYGSFSKIAPTRVLMKIVNKDKLPPGLPKNVLLSSWIPQVPVLKHNNTKVFITHGGLMGTQEALYCGVPMIGLPIFTDQFSNVEIYVRKNMAIRMDYDKINEESIDKSLNLILNDPKFKEAAKRESDLFRDRPMSSMDTVNFWVEYIIRNGADVLRSPAIDLYWYQVELLDVYGFLILSSVAIVYSQVLILKKFSIL